MANTTAQGHPIFYVACKEGNVATVEHLITTSNPNIEERVIDTVKFDNKTYLVKATALWFAADSANFEILSLLIKHKADINSTAIDGTTPLMWACYRKRMNVVKFLINQKADVNKAKWCGLTPLMINPNCRVCDNLLEKGAKIDARNVQGETALMAAAQNNLSEKVKFLISRNANVHLRNKLGDDALTIAITNYNKRTFSILLANEEYSDLRIAKAHELIGCVYINKANDYKSAHKHWRMALELRGNQLKVTLPSRRAYGNILEFRTLDELNECASDEKTMVYQSLIITERILGCSHPYTMKIIISQCLVDSNDIPLYRQTEFWTYATKLCVKNYRLIGENTNLLLKGILGLVLRSLENEHVCESTMKLHVFSMVQILAQEMTETVNILQLKPVFLVQQNTFDEILENTFYFICILDELYGDDELLRVRTLIKDILRCYPRSSGGDSLLHMAVSIDSIHDIPPLTSPKLRLTSLLCECGAKVDAGNCQNITPIHIASSPGYFKAEIVDVLLRFDSHVDWKDSVGNTPLAMLRSNPDYSLCEGNYLNLKCLAAAKVKEHILAFEDDIPKFLEEFVKLH